METQKFSQTQYKIVYLIFPSLNKLLGSSAASINKAKARLLGSSAVSINKAKARFLTFFFKQCFLLCRYEAGTGTGTVTCQKSEPAPQIPLCRRMLVPKPGQLRLRHWLSDATRLDLIFPFLVLICKLINPGEFPCQPWYVR
jgi:hypothetical protein